MEAGHIELAGRQAHAVGPLDLDAVMAERDLETVRDKADRDAIDQDARAQQLFSHDLHIAVAHGRVGRDRIDAA